MAAVFNISIHAPARGATNDNAESPISTVNFNPRSREGSDCAVLAVQLYRYTISIHAPARGATVYDTYVSDSAKFQSTLPRGERLRGRIPNILFTDPFQSTLPRGERRSPREPDRGYSLISIHAPARGATDSAKNTSYDTSISIHAPARGATQGREDHMDRLTISIHAPARGATAAANTALGVSGDFNPRSREGSDPP